MGGGTDFFNSLEILEPRCPKCQSILQYGLNTRYDEENNTHVCTNCNSALKE